MSPANERPRIDELFVRMAQLGASDLHLKAGNPPIFRIDGELRRTKAAPYSAKKIEALVRELIGEKRFKEVASQGSLDVGHEFEAGRVRVAVFMQLGRMSLVGRMVESEIPTLEELNLPPALARLIEPKEGLVLVCGTTGMGKSTTLASLLELLNRTKARHVLTFEDPVEFVHKDKLSVINQREFGLDFGSWPGAISSGVRADPDVMFVGEMRDSETFQNALTASATGHLVFSTLHSPGAAQTMGRILDMFPPDRSQFVRHSLAVSLNALISQRLVPSCIPDSPRVPAVEIMFTTPSIRKAIEEGEDARLGDLIIEGEVDGMQSWTKAFADLVKREFIEKKVAREFSPNKQALERALKGIDLSTSTLAD